MKEQENTMPVEAVERLANKQALKTHRPAMGTEDFMALYRDRNFRSALAILVNAHSQNPELREDMLQEAWLAISQSPVGLSKEVYLLTGGRAANNYRMRENRYTDMFRENWEIKKASERERLRILRAGRRAKIILKSCTK